eukprot:TRINITY_DN873_c0_g1_i1.p2 TRINITY_DN873_c0_g1~~TRINITY_DN873_c0_g1_i1.p2  ORF type:complete len:112 (+),score=17.61 TRINITY_DN873_c0_g1_i1:458-793(+)
MVSLHPKVIAKKAAARKDRATHLVGKKAEFLANPPRAEVKNRKRVCGSAKGNLRRQYWWVVKSVREALVEREAEEDEPDLLESVPEAIKYARNRISMSERSLKLQPHQAAC